MIPHRKRLVLICALLLLLFQRQLAVGQSVGSLLYQTTAGVGKERYIFACDPTLPPGGGFEFRKKADDRFYAQLWWSPLTNANPGQLRPVPGSRVLFRTGSTAGLINGKSKLEIPGTFGGDEVSFQLRYWEHDSGRLDSWEAALRAKACHGFSTVFRHVLNGVNEEGRPVFGSGPLAATMPTYLLPFPTTAGHELFLGYCVTPREGSSWVFGEGVPLRVSDWYGREWVFNDPLVNVYVDDRLLPTDGSPATEVILRGLSVGRHSLRVERLVDLGCCGPAPNIVPLGFASSTIDVSPASELPRIERQPEPVTTRVDPVRFEVAAIGRGVLRYQWFRNGEPLAGATQPSLLLANPKLQDEGYYSVRVSSQQGYASSDAVYLSFLRGNFRSLKLLAAEPSQDAPSDLEEVELWGGPQPDGLSRLGRVAWPFTGETSSLETVALDRDAYVQLRGRRAGAASFTLLSPIVWVPTGESEVQLGFSAQASPGGLHLAAYPGSVLVDHEPCAWVPRVSLPEGSLRHELRKDGAPVPNTSADHSVPASGLLRVTNSVAALGLSEVGSYRAVVTRGREIWLSPPVNLTLWRSSAPYLFPPVPPARRPTPLVVWAAPGGLYEVRSSPDLGAWVQETLVRSVLPAFEVYPAWRGREPHRFFRTVVLE